MDPYRLPWIKNQRLRTISSRVLMVLALLALCQFFMSTRTVQEAFERATSGPEEETSARTTPEEILSLLRQSAERATNGTRSKMNESLIRSIANRQFALHWNELGNEIGLRLREAFEAHSLLPCALDAGLLQAEFNAIESLYIASILRDAEEVMPNFIVQLSRVALRLSSRSLFISIYESESKDSTARWLLVLKLMLKMLGTPCKIIIHGQLHRAQNQTRSQFFAGLRRTVLRPMRNAHALRKSYQRLVFLDGVFFCAQQILRLNSLMADIACGLQFTNNHGTQSSTPDLVSYRAVGSSIDISGKRLRKELPYVQDSISRHKLLEGQPFAVHACWSGIVVMKVEPLYRGVVFRDLPKGSCPSSETVRVCEDFAKFRARHIVLDPGVRVAKNFVNVLTAYDPTVAKDLPFVEAKKRDKAVKFPSHPKSVDCCELAENDNSYDFKSCRTYVFQ